LRPEQPEPFLRGCAFEAVPGVPYPRANLASDRERLPGDTVAAASIPVGVRFELVGDAEQLEVEYETATDELGYRGEGAGRFFSLWRGGQSLAVAPAELGAGVVKLALRPGSDPQRPAILYLPEGMKPRVDALRGLGGDIEAAPVQPRWLCYGDSIAEGWVATEPALCWPARVGRALGLDVVNLGYAGAARGEIVSAEQIAELPAALLSITHGTNCWTRTPSSAAGFAEALESFVTVLRQGHPVAPLLAVSPLVRPDAEAQPNRLGATLADLRRAFEAVIARRIEAGDARIASLSGEKLISPEHLEDGIHPADRGHQRIAERLERALRTLLSDLRSR
jgi:lysophospholipase L1-like esterase